MRKKIITQKKRETQVLRDIANKKTFNLNSEFRKKHSAKSVIILIFKIPGYLL
jgi:hypothetical protein